MDSDGLTFEEGQCKKELFLTDGIHLTPDARLIWAEEYIVPALERVIDFMGQEGTALRK